MLVTDAIICVEVLRGVCPNVLSSRILHPFLTSADRHNADKIALCSLLE